MDVWHRAGICDNAAQHVQSPLQQLLQVAERQGEHLALERSDVAVRFSQELQASVRDPKEYVFSPGDVNWCF